MTTSPGDRRGTVGNRVATGPAPAEEALDRVIVDGPPPIAHRYRFTPVCVTPDGLALTVLPRSEGRPCETFEYVTGSTAKGPAVAFRIWNMTKNPDPNNTFEPSRISRNAEASNVAPRGFVLAKRPLESDGGRARLTPVPRPARRPRFERRREPTDGGGSSTVHNARNYPLVLAGGRSLGLQHGRYLQQPAERPLGDLFVTLLHRFDVSVTKFADNAGEFTEIVG